VNRPIRFEEALLYPYAEQRRARLLWVPGGLLFIVHLLTLLIGLIAAGALYMATGDIDEDAVEWKLLDVGLRLVDTVAGFLISLPLMGYLWKLMGQWREGRENDPSPPWAGHFWQYVGDGFKFMLYYIPAALVSFLPVIISAVAIIGFFLGGYDALSNLQAAGYVAVVLAVLVCIFITLAFMFFVTPYLMAPVVLSAKTRNLGDLFNLTRAWGAASRHYGAGLRATAWMIAAGFIYTAGNLLLFCSCVGCLFLPFLQFPYWITMAHLAHQVFPPETEAA